MKGWKNLFVLSCLAFADCSFAGQVNLCSILSKSKDGEIYLLDSGKLISKGPIDFGEYKYKFDPKRTFFEIVTGYFVAVPEKFEIQEGMRADFISYARVKDICPHTKLYS